jgi:hypothetical protein
VPEFSGSSSPCRPSPSLLAEGDTTILWLALALVLQDADLQPWISNLKFAASKTLNEKLINCINFYIQNSRLCTMFVKKKRLRTEICNEQVDLLNYKHILVSL